MSKKVSKHTHSHTHLDMVGKTADNLPVLFCTISNFFPDTKLQLPLVALFICTWLSVASVLILNKGSLSQLFDFIVQQCAEMLNLSLADLVC